jgi:hypothetical protein
MVTRDTDSETHRDESTKGVSADQL